MDTILDQLKKIYELSEKGLEGEKENAQELLKKLLKKYNLKTDDLLEEKLIKKKYDYAGIYVDCFFNVHLLL
jgi:hypothetical protein